MMKFKKTGRRNIPEIVKQYILFLYYTKKRRPKEIREDLELKGLFLEKWYVSLFIYQNKYKMKTVKYTFRSFKSDKYVVDLFPIQVQGYDVHLYIKYYPIVNFERNALKEYIVYEFRFMDLPLRK